MRSLEAAKPRAPEKAPYMVAWQLGVVELPYVLLEVWCYGKRVDNTTSARVDNTQGSIYPEADSQLAATPLLLS